MNYDNLRAQQQKSVTDDQNVEQKPIPKKKSLDMFADSSDEENPENVKG